MINIHSSVENQILNEPSFWLFKHKGLLCCVKRNYNCGNLNGYVAIDKDHGLYGKNYSDTIQLPQSPKFNGNYIGLLGIDDEEAKENIYSIDMAIDVHGGITFAADNLYGIEKNIFGDLWWFGFDTAHAGDLKPFQTDIDRKYSYHDDSVYRDFEYVKSETIKLADQLIDLK